MSLANSFNIEFSDAELQKIDQALKVLEEMFAGKLIQAMPNNQQQDDPESMEIENLCNMLPNEAIEASLLMPAFANMQQWGNDEKVREQLNPRASRLKNIAKQVIYTNRVVLHRCWNSSNKY